MAKPESRRLGKGLGALLGEYLEEPASGDVPLREVEIARIRPNPFQPRRQFEDGALDELEASIQENGLLQPLVVRPAGPDFELVAGERRWRVLRRLRWERAPTIIRTLSDEQMLVVALVENLQREDLGPLEEAVGYQQLIDGFGLTQKAVARRVGRDRSTVANALRLLTLPAAVRDLISSGALTAGHARAVLSIEGESAQVEFAREIVKKGFSVREAEARARSGRAKQPGGSKRAPAAQDPVARKAATLLSRAYGTDVKVSLRSKTRGEIRIPFRDADDFERLSRELLAETDADELFGVK
ncbi:MAG: ParB/RepB/Spo0J family partition protein [marine benthic group bacterium]|nr:ParB/RepB/Spo0J family partition protein [Candidatus Benthicola marisminoris]